jgi:hypothetical protein
MENNIVTRCSTPFQYNNNLGRLTGVSIINVNKTHKKQTYIHLRR